MALSAICINAQSFPSMIYNILRHTTSRSLNISFQQLIMFSSIVFITATSLMNPLLSATSPLSSAVAAFQAPSTLNLTSMGVSKGVSIMECWQLDNVFEETNQIGVPGLLQLQLGDLANMSYTVIPPKYFPPLHNAPNVQYVLSLTPFPAFSRVSTCHTIQDNPF